MFIRASHLFERNEIDRILKTDLIIRSIELVNHSKLEDRHDENIFSTSRWKGIMYLNDGESAKAWNSLVNSSVEKQYNLSYLI